MANTITVALKGRCRMKDMAGKQVSIQYTIILEGDIVIDSNIEQAPLTYIHGTNQMFPVLEKAIEEMKIGEEKTVEVKPEDGYGQHNPEMMKEVDKEMVPHEARKVGAKLQSTDSKGRPVHPFVAEIKGDKIVLDFNHPLAGKTAYYDIKLLGVHDTPED